MNPNAISAADLRTRLGAAEPPIVIDARRRPAFLVSREMIRGALPRDPDQVGVWAGSLPAAGGAVVYCVHGHEVSQQTAAALAQAGIEASYLEGGLEEGWKAAEGELDPKPANAATRWVTRERPKIDRIACPWLVARFVDPDAEFLYVPAKEVPQAAKEREAIPYDIPGVHFGHEGERCSFDAFIRHYRLADPAPGLLAISAGLSRNFADDHEMLRHGMVMYDALYSWCKAQAA